MRSTRTIGIIVSLLGFGIAIVAGMWLAVQATSGEFNTNDLLQNALLVFVPVALTTGSGIFMYIRQGSEEQSGSNIRQQRELMDIIRERGQVKMTEAADILQITDDDVRDMVYQLAELQIFDGYIDWEAGILYSTKQKMLE